MPKQLGDRLDPSGEEAVHADHEMFGVSQQIADMTPEKPRSTCQADRPMSILLSTVCTRSLPLARMP